MKNDALPLDVAPEDVRSIARRVQAGSLAGAREAAGALLQTRPDDYYALHLAGVIALI